jgi:hypothetical protein
MRTKYDQAIQNRRLVLSTDVIDEKALLCNDDYDDDEDPGARKETQYSLYQ